MATTWLMLKEAVANNLGKTDGATFNTKREDALNRARRKFYSERHWSFLEKDSATLTFTSQVATLPTDYNIAFDPVCVYVYVGNVKYDYRQVEWADLTAYGTLDYVYALDRPNRQIKISQTTSTLSLDYTYLPVDYTAIDGSQDTSVEPTADTTAIELLATAYFYLSSRQSGSKFKDFSDEYQRELQNHITRDARTSTPRFFRRMRTLVNRGYQSQF